MSEGTATFTPMTLDQARTWARVLAADTTLRDVRWEVGREPGTGVIIASRPDGTGTGGGFFTTAAAREAHREFVKPAIAGALKRLYPDMEPEPKPRRPDPPPPVALIEDRAFAYALALNDAIARGRRDVALALGKAMLTDLAKSGLDFDRLSDRMLAYFAGEEGGAEEARP